MSDTILYPVTEKSTKALPYRTVNLQDFPTPAVTPSDETIGYLQHRSIEIATVKSLSSVYFTASGICFVLTGNGLGWQTRVFGNGPRFHFPARFNSSSFVYVPDTYRLGCSKLVFIVEGSTDALAVHQEEFPAIALLGSMIPDARIATIRSLTKGKELVMIGDNDSSGYQASAKVQRELGARIVLLPSRYKDISEAPIECRKWLLNYATMGVTP